MGLPGHRRTSSHKRRRASHFALSPAAFTACPSCKTPIRPHHACTSCGRYDGKMILSMDRKNRRAAKAAEIKGKPVAADAHAGHDHSDGHTHEEEALAEKPKKAAKNAAAKKATKTKE